jgi:prefoldin subunit 5
MNPNIENLTRRLAMADRSLLALEALMAQTRDMIETVRQAIADVQEVALRSAPPSERVGP